MNISNYARGLELLKYNKINEDSGEQTFEPYTQEERAKIEADQNAELAATKKAETVTQPTPQATSSDTSTQADAESLVVLDQIKSGNPGSENHKPAYKLLWEQVEKAYNAGLDRDETTGIVKVLDGAKKVVLYVNWKVKETNDTDLKDKNGLPIKEYTIEISLPEKRYDDNTLSNGVVNKIVDFLDWPIKTVDVGKLEVELKLYIDAYAYDDFLILNQTALSRIQTLYEIDESFVGGTLISDIEGIDIDFQGSGVAAIKTRLNKLLMAYPQTTRHN